MLPPRALRTLSTRARSTKPVRPEKPLVGSLFLCKELHASCVRSRCLRHQPGVMPFVQANSILPASLVSLYGVLQPLFTVLLSFAVFGSPLLERSDPDPLPRPPTMQTPFRTRVSRLVVLRALDIDALISSSPSDYVYVLVLEVACIVYTKNDALSCMHVLFRYAMGAALVLLGLWLTSSGLVVTAGLRELQAPLAEGHSPPLVRHHGPHAPRS